jgi:hypothetical protein
MGLYKALKLLCINENNQDAKKSHMEWEKRAANPISAIQNT